ncbi:MAG TPA: Stp1/IreP family PP2C-type Ser/Thr phosphatase [Usitatibacter sp.]|jgi:protein phosphatase|nr:Stp1/IreP family PP2C-type Ser/Thr phosphatase [Usitatibacter sp.]
MMQPLLQALAAASLTDPGRVRDHNEDCIESRPDIGLFVLADGMGGYNAGEVASGMATSLISDGLEDAWSPRAVERMGRDEAKALSERLINEQIARANTAIFTTSQNNPECAGMGTTLVVALFYDNFLTVAHIGDSRLYRLRGESMEQVTRDHSLLQEQLDSGLITPEEAKLSQNKNLVTRALGIDPSVEPELHVYETQPDDTYLLCSDGLSDMVEDEEIRLTLITLKSNPNLTVQQLVQAANDNGGRDNISAMLIRVVGPFGVPRGWIARLKALFR